MADLTDDQVDLITAWSASVRESHQARVDAILERLDPRETAIVREAAVMGFVQGVMHAGGLGHVEIPKDSHIVYRTLDGIGGQRATFPNLSGWTEDDDA